MWFRDEPIVVRRHAPNRRRRKGRQDLLMVNAKVSERRKNRAQRIAAVVLTLVAVLGLLWLVTVGVRATTRLLFTHNAQYRIRKLDLSSDGQLKKRHIREYAHLAEGMNLFAVNVEQVRKDLASVPLVNTVEVSRRLPDTLVVRLTERIALARLGVDDRRNHLAIDRHGHVLGPSSRRPGLPAITGLRDRGLRPGSYLSQKLVGDALAVLDICDTTRLGQVVKVKSIDVRNPEFLDMRLAGGERVLLGRDRLEWRLKRLASSLQKAEQLGKAVAAIDLTVNKNPPVEWR